MESGLVWDLGACVTVSGLSLAVITFAGSILIGQRDNLTSNVHPWRYLSWMLIMGIIVIGVTAAAGLVAFLHHNSNSGDCALLGLIILAAATVAEFLLVIFLFGLMGDEGDVGEGLAVAKADERTLAQQAGKGEHS